MGNVGGEVRFVLIALLDLFLTVRSEKFLCEKPSPRSVENQIIRIGQLIQIFLCRLDLCRY